MLIDEEDYEELYFLTYNTLLTKSGIAATGLGRVKAILEEIEKRDADVVCLQEVFPLEVISNMTDKLELAGWDVYVDHL